MNIRKIIKEAVIADTVNSTKSDLKTIKESIIKQLMIEGVDDPGILKCVFLAGGPGSGKGYTSQELFGVQGSINSSMAQSGLKVVNSDTAFEAAMKKNGINSKKLADIEKNDPELWSYVSTGKNSLRNKAKDITAKQKSFYEMGRLGMIIDGTGHKYDKIKDMKNHAEELGYDTYMVFVNTSLEVAKERNQNRDRVVPDDVLVSSWQAVQNNLGKFKGLFGGNFEIVDNTSYKKHPHSFKNKKAGTVDVVLKPVVQAIHKHVNQFVNAKVKNPVGKKWIETAKMLKNRKMIK